MDIVITDVNDNAPVFSQSVYSADIAVDMSVGSTVVTVSATDADAGINARISYAFVNSSQYFKVRQFAYFLCKLPAVIFFFAVYLTQPNTLVKWPKYIGQHHNWGQKLYGFTKEKIIK